MTTRPRPWKVAAATALANAGFGKSNMDPNLRNICEDWLNDTATWFGVNMFASRSAYNCLHMAMTHAGIDVDAMEKHYALLCDLDSKN